MIIDNVGLGGIANDRLLAFAESQGLTVNLEEIRVKIMEAHAGALARDGAGTIGLLTPGEIADYHHKVFSKYGLPARTFGGTPVTGGVWEASVTRLIWCWGCEW